MLAQYVAMGRIEEVLAPEEALKRANKLKDQGNEAFKLEKFDEALDYYTQGARQLKKKIKFTETSVKRGGGNLISIFLL